MISSGVKANARQAAKGTASVVVLALIALVASNARAQDGPTPTTSIVWVVPSDDGSPVFLHYSPHEGDRAAALEPGTPLAVLSDEVEGDGQRWYAVRTPEDAEGYVLVLSTSGIEGPPTTAADP
jgi:hypothetical protein